MTASTLTTKARPTNQDVIAKIAELHDCLHSVDEKIDKVKTDVADTKERIAKVEGFQFGIATHLRVPAAGAPMPSFWERWKTPVAVGGGVLGAMVAFVSLYPVLRVVLLALDHAMVAAR